MDSDANEPARREMRRAVETFPRNLWFGEALCLLSSAVTIGPRRNQLLEVLQRERRFVERQAVRAGLPAACLGEVCLPRSLGTVLRTRTGVFESDVIHVYLPDFLARANLLELRRGLPSFALHASDTYRDRLRQIARRERRRSELLHHAERDARCHVEYPTYSREGEHAMAAASPAMATWIPSPEERMRERSLHELLRQKLEPMDYQVAQLFMQGLIHQGDKCEIARLLGVSPARITAAVERIKGVLLRYGSAV